MLEKDFNRYLGSLVGTEADQARDVIDYMMSLLDEADLDDYFGTEGWRHLLGWDE